MLHVRCNETLLVLNILPTQCFVNCYYYQELYGYIIASLILFIPVLLLDSFIYVVSGRPNLLSFKGSQPKISILQLFIRVQVDKLSLTQILTHKVYFLFKMNTLEEQHLLPVAYMILIGRPNLLSLFTGKFQWHRAIKNILKEADDHELAVKKLRKKVIFLVFFFYIIVIAWSIAYSIYAAFLNIFSDLMGAIKH